MAKTISKSGYAAAVIALLTGCAIGPDFKRPDVAPGAGFTQAPLPASTAAVDGQPAQNFRANEGISAQWWTLFQSPQLNALIDHALANNPTLQSAEAALRQAQALLAAQRSILFPALDGQVNGTRQQSFANFGSGQAITIPPFTITSASLQLSYAIDLWGTSRRALETTRAQAEQAEFQLEAAHLTLTSNIVIAAVNQAALRAQYEATRTILDAQEQQLGVLRRQLELGGIAEADVLTQQTGVAQTRAQLPPIERALAQTGNQLLALAGRFPNDLLISQFDLNELRLPENLPVSLPSQLVVQRPDIRAAEAYLHAANAQVGVATGLMLPQISINANYGRSAMSFDALVSGGGSTVWGMAAGLTQPIFRGGELLNRRKAAVAAFDAAAAQYRGTVLTAFQNVSDVLAALQIDANAVQAQLDAERAAAENLSIAQNRFQSGATNFLTLLDAQRTYQQTRIALVQAQSARYTDTAALFIALGGGWWNRDAQQAQNQTESENAQTVAAAQAGAK